MSLPPLRLRLISIVSLLSLTSLSSCHVFLPRTNRRSLTSLTSDLMSARRFRRNYGKYGFFARLQEIRGGADAGCFQESIVDYVEDSADPSAEVVNDFAVVESSIASSRKGDGCGVEVQTEVDDDETPYATIGVLNIPSSNHGDNIIMLSYKCFDDPDRQMNERWGVSLDATPIEATSVTNGCDANSLALAEVNGCLCNGIVLNLALDLFRSESIALEELDEILLCLAEGLIRRLRGTQKMMFPLSISFNGGGQENDYDMQYAKGYIKGYLDRALFRLWELHFGKTPGVKLACDELLILQQCQVDVSSSNRPFLDTAVSMAKTFHEKYSAEEISHNNIVSRPLFGVLYNRVYNEIRNGWISSNGRQNEMSVEWSRLTDDSQDTTKELNISIPIPEEVGENKGQENDTTETVAGEIDSAHLRRKVVSAMATAFVDAEESLLRMENKIDEIFLESDQDEHNCPMPEFGSDADAVVSAMSAIFQRLLDENETMTESDREWVEAKRMAALKQVVETGLHRLFHLHLQSLRDHFGRCYELMLEKGPSVDDFDAVGHSSKKDRRLGDFRREAARQAEERFMKEAIGSIPQICQHPEGELCNQLSAMYSCEAALQGLLEDMYEATLACGLEEEEWEDIMRVNRQGENEIIDLQKRKSKRIGLRQLIKNMKAGIQKRGPAKWYERLAVKVFVIGINYVQGWIMLQTLRREARRRDQAMPKFPLF